jgi:hypothetical protein
LLELLLLLLLLMMLVMLVVLKHMLLVCKSLDQVMTDRTDRLQPRTRTSSRSRSGGRSCALIPRPATDHIPLQGNRSVDMVQLVVETTGIAQDFARVVLAPERGECRPAVGAHGLHVCTACGRGY